MVDLITRERRKNLVGWFGCNCCNLMFTVVADSDEEIEKGKPFVCFCPRCGSAELERAGN